jgi:antitoxin (DNA-binding transcriptional repressor) of toxin-antitoxin stability system
MTVTINATQARQNFFDILAAAKNKKQITKIKLNGLVVAKIVPEVEEQFDWDKYEKEAAEAVERLRKYNWDDVLEFRKKTKIRRYKGW